MGPKYTLKIECVDIDELHQFLRASGQPPLVDEPAEGTPLEQIPDRRGLKTREFHARARQLRAANPSLTYKEAYRMAVGRHELGDSASV